MPFPPDLPPHDQLADLLDEDGWDVNVHGRMVDFATDGAEIPVDIHEEEVPDAVHDPAPA